MMLKHIRFAVAALFVAVSITAAAQTPSDQPIRIERISVDVRLEADGTWVQTTEQRFKLQSQSGVEQAGQMVFVYDVTMQKFEVLSAYTQKPDGRKVEVKKDAIFVRDLPASTGAPMFADIKVVVIVFPEIAVGDSLLAQVHHEQLQPMFPGQYSNLFFVSPHALLDENRITLRVPAAVALRVANEGYDEKRTNAGDFVSYEWSARNTQVEAMERGSVAQVDYSKRLQVSTFAGFPAFARAYSDRAQDKARPSAAVKKLADEITAGATAPREQAKRLYDWVSRNIRYVGIFLGMGAVVPHAADEVLANRYGDCKDQVTLLSALLAAKGIEARTAIVSAGDSYWIGALPVLANFNHVIVYLPGLDVWADPTATRTRFGRLPLAVQGKTAVLAPTGELRSTPFASSDTNVTSRVVRYEIKGDGSIAGTSHINTKGIRAESYRRSALALTPEKMHDYVRTQTTNQRYKGEGNAKFTGVDDRNDDLVVEVDFTLGGGIDWPGSGSFEVPSGFRGGEHISTQIRANAAAANKRASVAGAVETLIEEYQIVLPLKMKIVALPTAVSFKNEVASYDTTVRQEGQTIYITRKLVDLYQTAVIPPSLFKATEEKSAAIARDLRSQIVYTNE